MENIEQSRMATVLKTPELFSELISLDSTNWILNGNKWIWETSKKHFDNFKTVPTINILLDYADKDKSADSNLSIIHAKTLLNDYQLATPLDDTYFKQVMFKEIADAKIKDGMSILLDVNNPNKWQEIRTLIDNALKPVNPLPDRLDLKSLMTKPSNDNQNLLNEWAFERQAILAIVAPTGIGKSVLTMQLSTHFACGKSVIGFKPHRPYRVLVIQNEDSDNDIALMRDGSMPLLNDEEKQLTYDNLFFIRLRGSSGKSFLMALETYCKKYNPDIIFVNPLLKYYGGDPLNTKEVSNFLNELEPILERYNCGLILVHHTVKQSKTSRLNQVDSSYSGFGSSAWSNSVRDTIEIRSSKTDGYYQLIAGKRSGKWGWREKYIKRSDNPLKPHWIEVEANEIETLSTKDKSNAVSSENYSKVCSLIPYLPETVTVQGLVNRLSLSDKTLILRTS